MVLYSYQVSKLNIKVRKKKNEELSNQNTRVGFARWKVVPEVHSMQDHQVSQLSCLENLSWFCISGRVLGLVDRLDTAEQRVMALESIPRFGAVVHRIERDRHDLATKQQQQ